MLEINVFDGLDGDTIIEFTRDGTNVNFAAEGVTKLQLVSFGRSVNGVISGNKVTFKAGHLGLKPGGYLPKIVAYTSEKPNGFAIAGPGEEVEITMKYHA